LTPIASNGSIPAIHFTLKETNMSVCPGFHPFPALLPLRARARVVNELTKLRLDRLLPQVMRETGIDMWIMICWEDAYDPVFRTMIPWECWAPILQMVVLYNQGAEKGVERLNISRTNMQGLMTNVWYASEPENQWEWLRRIVAERNPKRIGINQSDVIWAADGLSAALKDKLAATLGPVLAARMVSAEPLATRWLETRLPEELAIYPSACAIAHALIAECFSRVVITPGVTTTQDLRWHYWQRAAELGLTVSFPPFFRIFRPAKARAQWGEADNIIRPGDMLHCDVGIQYLRFLTDHQELAYVLRPGETDAPAGLRAGMAQANRLQEILTSTWQKGLTGNEILTRALQQARAEGLAKPKIYSHSLSHYLHEPGPLMGLPWEQVDTGARGEVRMAYNTTYTVELSVTLAIAEWENEETPIPMEQDGAYTEGGAYFVDGRQTRFHLV
jgi:Xaa-Pro aminopeptidase